MPTPTIDYDALANQARSASTQTPPSQPASGTPAPINYDALADQARQTPAAPQAPSYSDGPGIIPGVLRAAKNMYHMPGSIWDALTGDPSTDEEKMIAEQGIDSPEGHIPAALALPFWRLVGAPMEASQKKADQYKTLAATETNPKIKKQLLDAAGVYGSVGSHLPVLGPMAAQMAERGAYGPQGASEGGDNEPEGILGNSNADLSGATSEGITYGIAPKIAEEGAGLVSDAAKAGLDAAKGKLAPVEDTSTGSPIPVRNPGFLARQAAKAVTPEVLKKFTTEQTGPAAMNAVGNTFKDATGTEAEVSPTGSDRMGVSGIGDAKLAEARGVFQKIDELSGGKLQELQDKASDAANNDSAGYRKAMDDQTALFDEYAKHPDLADEDVIGAKQNYKNGLAIKLAGQKLTTAATEASPTGELEYQLKPGDALLKTVDGLQKSGVLDDTGLPDTYVEQLKKIGRLVNDQATLPKYSPILGALTKLVGAGIGFAHGGPVGAGLGYFGESPVEKVAVAVRKAVADRTVGRVLTNPNALSTLNTAVEGDVPADLAASTILHHLTKAEPSFLQVLKSQLWDNDSGSFRVPGTGTDEPLDAATNRARVKTLQDQEANPASSSAPSGPQSLSDEKLAEVANPDGVFVNSIRKQLNRTTDPGVADEIVQDTLADFTENVKRGVFKGEFGNKSIMTNLQQIARNKAADWVTAKTTNPLFSVIKEDAKGFGGYNSDSYHGPEEGLLPEEQDEGRLETGEPARTPDADTPADEPRSYTKQFRRNQTVALKDKLLADYHMDNLATAPQDTEMLDFAQKRGAANSSSSKVRANTSDRVWGLSEKDYAELGNNVGMSATKARARLAEITEDLRVRAKQYNPRRFYPGYTGLNNTVAPKTDPFSAAVAAMTKK